MVLQRLGLIAIGAVLLSPAAFAQDESKGETLTLEEIIVTAQRREESLQDVPLSVQAIAPEALTQRNINDLYQLPLAAPSLQMGQDNTFTIRGAGTLAFANSLDSSVAVAVDEVNLGRRFLLGAVFNDIQQVEVLNGPQGLLFGKNASAGLLNITTVKPQLGVTEGSADLEYAVRDTTPDNGTSTIVRGVFNLPVGERSALRLNAHYSTEEPVAKIIAQIDNGQRVDETTDDYGVKVKYLFEPNEQWRIYLIADANRESGIAGNFDRTYRQLAPGSSKQAPVDSDGVTPGPENLEYGNDWDNYRDVDIDGLQAKISYLFDNGMELSNIAAWRSYELFQSFDSDSTTANDLNINRNHTNYDQFTNELRLAIPASERINGQVGLYYFDLQQDQDALFAGDGQLPAFLLPNFPFCVGAEVVPGPPPNCSHSNDYFLGSDRVNSLDTTSVAAFGQFDFNLTDAFKLTAGLRYTRDEISIELANMQRYSYFSGIGAPAVMSASDSSDNWSGKLAGQYSFSEDLMAYVSYSRGYKGPGYNDLPSSATQDIFIRPETVDNFEVGMKSSWFDRRFMLNITLFDQNFDDYQVQAFDGPLGQFIVQNAASLSSKGAEVTFSWLALENLTINGAAAFLDATFDSFPGASCYPQQPNCDPAVGFDAAGLTTPMTADFTSTLDGTYEFALGDSATGFVTANYYHRDAVNFIIARPPETDLGSVDLFGFSVGARFDNGFTVSLFCKNCTDEKVPTFIALDAGDSATRNVATSVQAWGFNSVRNIGIRVAYQF